MSHFEPHVWYDFSQDRRRPLALRVAWLERDADAVLWRELRLAEMVSRHPCVPEGGPALLVAPRGNASTAGRRGFRATPGAG